MSTSDTNGSGTKFDAPRPAVTNRLGKKRTDELIQADGDTWQEYLAVSEKPKTKSSNGSSHGGALSFFGKKNKKKSGSNSTSNGSDSSNLIIRSYFQNMRTGKKVWDEPPSGASNIVPASEEMRRMAEMQLGELYVKTTTRADGGSMNESNDSTNKSSKKKSSSGGLFGRSNTTNGSNSGSKGENAGSGVNTQRRIRYKPDSALNTTGPASKSDGKSNESLHDRHLQEAIKRSMYESYGIPTETNETEEEVLRRVLEESRLEASSAAKTRGKNHSNDSYDYNDRKPPARKHPPTSSNNRRPSSKTTQNDRRLKQQQEVSSSSSARRRSPSGGGKNASRRSRSDKTNLQDQAGFV